MFRKISDKVKDRRLSMRAKLTLSLLAIAVSLLVSSIISIMEYSRMSHYVSDLMADDIRSINLAQKLSEVTGKYNLDILSVIGDDAVTTLPDFHQKEFMSHCDSLRMSLEPAKMMPLTDSVVYAYSAYMLTSLELNDVLLSDFIDTRSWYFDRLQPRFKRLNNYIDTLNDAIYDDLKKNSETFQRGFYRSIIPGAVAVMVGLLLILMLLFFILAYYVNPIYKMLSGLNNYRSYNKKYNYSFEGDDQLAELNEGIAELAGENQQLRRRVSDLRAKLSLGGPSTSSGTEEGGPNKEIVMNVKVISRNVGYALLVSALFMFLSILVSVANGNDSALAALLISFTITFTVGIFPFIFVRKTSAISLKDGYMIIVLSWLLSFIFGMLPYALWGGPFTLVNAWFESVSGFTTTGASILENVEGLPNSLLFWRASTHFIGGLGVVVFLLLIIPTSSQMRLRLTNLELSSLSKREYRSGSGRTVYIFTNVYLGMAVASFALYLLAGMGPLDAVCHAMSVTATGGFSTRNLSIGAFDSVPIDLITMFFMFLSSIHFGMTYVAVATRSLKPFKNEIFKFYLWSLIIATLIVSVSLKVEGVEQAWGGAILSGSFHVLSYSSTSGFGIGDNSVWPILPSIILVFVGIWCGMAGSTTGGIKSDRALLLCKQIKFRLKTVLHPASVNEVRINRRVVRQDDITPHILYIALYMMLIILSIAINLIINPDNANAIAATFTSLSNVGPSIGELGAVCNFNAEPAGAKLMYTFDMFLGRVEIYPILAVVMMFFSKSSK